MFGVLRYYNMARLISERQDNIKFQFAFGRIDTRFIFNQAINVHAASRWWLRGKDERLHSLGLGIAGLFPTKILIATR